MTKLDPSNATILLIGLKVLNTHKVMKGHFNNFNYILLLQIIDFVIIN